MQEEVNSTVLVVIMTTMAVSLALLFLLFQKHIGGQPLLAYEPRRRVPWGLPAVALALFVPVTVTAIVVAIVAATLLPEGFDLLWQLLFEDFLFVGWLISAVNIGFVLVAILVLATVVRADAMDLGWPETAGRWARDVGTGIVGCLAAMLPIYLVNLAMVNLLESREQHPLVEQIRDAGSPEIVLVGILMAIVAAPLYEEFTFRLLLQGWLEKVEDRLVGWDATSRAPANSQTIEELDDGNSAVIDTMDVYVNNGMPVDDPPVLRPTRGMIGDLPHGWTPVLVSGTVFGLAHLGQGVAPVPLVLFGIVLGYMYQRTHRLVPCIVAHMLFNAYSLSLVWLSKP